jgi:hypothetical protein
MKSRNQVIGSPVLTKEAIDMPAMPKLLPSVVANAVAPTAPPIATGI